MKTRDIVKEAVQKLGYKKLRKAQIQPINDLMDGKDILLIAPTSMGKSAVFQVPGLARAKQKPGSWVLVIEPTLALIYDQVRRLQEKGIPAAYLTGKNTDSRESILTEVRRGEIVFLFTTPEQMQKELFQRMVVANHNPWLVVVDEAHCITEWGTFNFRPAYRSIGQTIQKMKHRPVIAAMTATAPVHYRLEIMFSLKMRKPCIHEVTLSKPNLKLIVKDYTLDTSRLDCGGLSKRKAKVEREKMMERNLQARLKEMVRLTRKYLSEGSVIVYATTRSTVEHVYEYLKEQDDLKGKVAKYHAGLRQEKKEKVLVSFFSGKKKIIVATSAFGMGIDKTDVRLVLNFEVPLSPVEWYQQIGRAGRDGETAHAVLFYRDEDVERNRALLGDKRVMQELENLSDKQKEIQVYDIKQAIDRLESLASLVHSDTCLVQELLKYLGEKNPPVCGHCTVCQRNRKKKGV